MLTRRQAWLAVFAGFFAWRPAPANAAPAQLSIDLGRWSSLEITHEGVTKRFTTKDIFEALR